MQRGRHPLISIDYSRGGAGLGSHNNRAIYVYNAAGRSLPGCIRERARSALLLVDRSFAERTVAAVAIETFDCEMVLPKVVDAEKKYGS